MSAAGARVSDLARGFGASRPRTGAVEEAQHEQHRHEEHQLPVKLCPDGELLLGRVELRGGRRAGLPPPPARPDDDAVVAKPAAAWRRHVSLVHDQLTRVGSVGLGPQVVKVAVIVVVDVACMVAVVEEAIGARLGKRRRNVARSGAQWARGTTGVEGHRSGVERGENGVDGES